MENNILLNIKDLISRLPHSATRVPYTYHHDYLRENTHKFSGMSRSEVAASHEHSELTLYALALMSIMNELGSAIFLEINSSDLETCRKAVLVAEAIKKTYKND